MNRYRQHRLLQQTAEREFPIGLARVELDAGVAGRIVADTLNGDARVELYEEDPTEIYMFAVARPLRTLNVRRRIRFEIDAVFEQMTVTLPPDPEKARER